MTLLWHVEERQLKKSRPPSRTSRRRYRDVPPLPISPARVDWTIEASRLLRRRPPALGTSVCTCSTPTASRAEAADWRRRHKSPTRPSASGEGWDRVYYVPARPRPLGEHGGEPHGLRFARPFRASRIAAVVGAATMSLAIYGAHHRFTTSIIDTVLRSLGGLLISYRVVLISDRRNSRYSHPRTESSQWRERVNACS